MALPNYLIVGVPESGVISFFEYFMQPPDVYVPFCKGSYSFSDAFHPAFVKNDFEYTGLFIEGKGKKAVEEIFK